jgi:F0F1-type ATP synthase membrane subunit a
MSRLFSFNQVQKRIVSTLTILILIVGSFYFLYLPKNEKEVNSRMFRSLERIHDNVKSKLDNNYRLLEIILKPIAILITVSIQ